MKNKELAYIRVSSYDQNEDRQLIAMKKIGIRDKYIYIDKQSGKDFQRPAYEKMISEIKKGDLLYVYDTPPPFSLLYSLFI